MWHPDSAMAASYLEKFKARAVLGKRRPSRRDAKCSLVQKEAPRNLVDNHLSHRRDRREASFRRGRQRACEAKSCVSIVRSDSGITVDATKSAGPTIWVSTRLPMRTILTKARAFLLFCCPRVLHGEKRYRSLRRARMSGRDAGGRRVPAGGGVANQGGGLRPH
jgi:hypothetical protein